MITTPNSIDDQQLQIKWLSNLPWQVFIICMAFTSGAPTLGAQKAIQLEKGGSFKTTKFFIGDQLVYRLKSDPKHWLREFITEIHIDEGLIEFENRVVPIGDIYAIQTQNGTKTIRSVSWLLTYFSGTWTFWTLVSLAYGDPLALSTVIIGVGSFAIGQLLKLAFFKTHRIKGRKRLRMIDLTFYQMPLKQKRT